MAVGRAVGASLTVVEGAGSGVGELIAKGVPGDSCATAVATTTIVAKAAITPKRRDRLTAQMVRCRLGAVVRDT